MPYKDPEERKRHQREYHARKYHENLEESRRLSRERYREHPEAGKRWRAKNPERVKELSRETYARHSEKYKQKAMEWQKANPHRSWAISTLSNHRRRGFLIAISIDDLMIEAKKAQECLYCGRELKFMRGGGWNGSTPSLDRINNEDVIDENTIQIICHACNTSKLNRTHTEFIEYRKLVVDNFGETR